MTRTYTCPMHPEVRQPGPGSCPKCGMALEPDQVWDLAFYVLSLSRGGRTAEEGLRVVR